MDTGSELNAQSSRGKAENERICIVADRGMVSAETVRELENPGNTVAYILGTRMRKVKEIRDVVLSHRGRYKEVRGESGDAKDSEPLKVKQLQHNGHRYFVCCNPRQARKEARDREMILSALKVQIKKGAKSLVGNKSYRKYLKIFLLAKLIHRINLFSVGFNFALPDFTRKKRHPLDANDIQLRW